MAGIAEVVILLLVALTACFSPVQMVKPPASPLIVAAGPSSVQDGCKAIVSFTSTAQHMNVEVQVEAEPGIRFEDTGEPMSGWHPLVLQSEETRTEVFECYLDANLLKRAGEYRVMARVRLAGEFVPFKETQTVLLVAVRADGMPHALNTAHPADTMFMLTYVLGLENLAYALDLGARPMPDQGWLYIRVDGSGAVDAPQLVLSVAPGIRFGPSAETIAGAHLLDVHRLQVDLDAIASGGARFVAIPIQLEPNCLAGVYSVEVVEVAAGMSWGEIAPVVLEIVSDPAQPGYAYSLTAGNRAARALDATVVAAVLAGQPVAEAPDSAEPGANPTPTPQPTPQPELPIAPEQPAAPLEDARAESAPQDGLVWQWSYRITGYGGRLWELWLHYVRPQATMPYAQFEALMPVYNPHYAVERVFDPAAVYNLPVGGPTIVGAEAR